MRITDVKTTTIEIPLKDGKRFATRTILSRYYTITHIHTDAGITGWGYCWGTPLVSEAIDSLLKDFLIGEDPRNISRLWNKMYHNTEVWGRRGILVRAISVVDGALWDLLGKICDQPIHKLLGGYRDKAKAYYSGGYYPVSCTTDNELLTYIEEEMGTYRDKGFTSFKMKIGAGTMDLDMKRVALARKTIGDDAELMVDANNLWDSNTAIKVGRMIEKYDIRWFEEPVRIDNLTGCARVAEALDIPIAIGENHFTRWEFDHILEKKAAEIFQGDPTLMGGITEYLRIVNVAEMNDIQLAPHWTHDVNVQVACGVEGVMISEYFELESDIFNFQAVLANPVKAENGYITPPEGAGHGLILDTKAVEHYLLK